MDNSYLNIESLNCRCCGGVLKVKSSLCVCDYCGATNFISNVTSKYVSQLNRANKLRQEREFDNAARIYDVILEENEPTADILWLRTLCEYGIEYVPDPVSDKYFPTLHRINDESILSYHSYIDALSLADDEQKKLLSEEAENINNIQNEYLRIVENEKPYDIFICYKETDETTGEKTEDVELADQLFCDLTARGFKVFFAKETLKMKLSINYEPYIFAALKSARAMVVLGTKAEYFMSVWVKNEWGRFLKLMQDNDKKQMFFACDDPEELPRAFVTKQAQLLGEEGALKNLADNVERFLRNTTLPEYRPNSDLEILYNKALSFVISKNDVNGTPYIEKLISRYPDYAPGYWLRLLNKNKADPTIISRMPLDLYSDPDYEKAVSLAVGDLKEGYMGIAATCKKNLADQEEFDKILEEKSIEYATDFRKTETGQKRNEIIKNLARFAETFDIYNNRQSLTFAVGLFIYILGILLMCILFSVRTGLFPRIYGYDYLELTMLLSSPLIVVGAAVLLSYNWVLDFVTVGIVVGFLWIAALFPGYGALIFLALITPIAVYLITNSLDNINKRRDKMYHAYIKMLNELEDLNSLTDKTVNEFNVFGSKLLMQYKEEKNISSLIELKEDDYKKELENINNLNKNAQDGYKKYLGYFDARERAVYRTDTVLGAVSLFLLIFPPFSIFSFVVSIIDIAKDKYKEHTHTLSVVCLIASVFILILLVLIVDMIPLL